MCLLFSHILESERCKNLKQRKDCRKRLKKKRRESKEVQEMGAVAPLTRWIPEDDALLKNSVEAGASLESLAKGAVQFSRRFTIQELQDRWHSLLYDPVVSEEASAYMIELERSASTYLSRPNKSESLKERKCSPGKRKAETIRQCYYRIRKRICNESFDIMDINVLSGLRNSNFGIGNELASADFVIGNPVSNNFGIQGPDGDTSHRSLSELVTRAAESTGNEATPYFQSGQNYGQDIHVGGKNVSQIYCQHYEENISLPGDYNVISEIGQSKELPVSDLFEAEGLDNAGNSCSEFGGTPFCNFGGSSPLPQVLWRDISASGLPVQLGENDQHTGDAFIRPQVGDVNKTKVSRYEDGDCSNYNLKSPLSCDSMKHLRPSREEYFAELSNTLFDFTNEDEPLFMDAEGKDSKEKFYYDDLSSLLLDSPNQSELLNVSLSEAAVAADAHVDKTDTHPGVSNNQVLQHCDQDIVSAAQVSSSASTVKGFGPEYRNGVICCSFNTEDPEIPSNDDVFLPFRCPSPSNPSEVNWRLHDACNQEPLSFKDFSSTQKANAGPLMMKNNQKDSNLPYCVIGSLQSSNVDHGVKYELPSSNIQHKVIRNVKTGEGPCPMSSENLSSSNIVGTVVNMGAIEMDQEKNLDYRSPGPSPDKHAHCPDILRSFQKNACGFGKELNSKVAFPKNDALNAELSFQKATVAEPIDTSMLSDKEELCSENDFDVPYFSDVEAMILDMDLSADELDLFTKPEVLRYQFEESKRTIIKLEQAAGACTQRAIAAHGAFAVLYGRFSKHFIKKPEVLLGRATEDVRVDIDLGREKIGGKISRRQATIKMDINGFFNLNNLGKCSIYVNGEEVAPGWSLSLPSGCLVEIRGLAFVFETNHALIKQYTNSVMNESLLQDQKLSSRS